MVSIFAAEGPLIIRHPRTSFMVNIVVAHEEYILQAFLMGKHLNKVDGKKFDRIRETRERVSYKK